MDKKLLLVVVLALGILKGFTQNVNIPDANFKAYLVGNTSINTNGDTEIQVSEANTYSGNIACSSLGISDLTGIEAFTAMGILVCNDNNLSTLDISQNTTMTRLYCSNNNLSSLDVTQNTSLNYLICDGNNLSSLDISQNPSLTNFQCQDNNISSLDISAQWNLTIFRCQNNNLTTLDASNNLNMQEIRCNDNQLTALNMKNLNTSLCWVDATNNPNLTCIDVTNVSAATAAWTQIDATTSFSLDCSTSSCSNIVTIPDANFKAALVAHGSSIAGGGISTIDTDGDGEICQTEAQAYTGTINVSNNNITDLTGIEAFVNLIILQCHFNQLTSLDVSANTALTRLYCNNNQLTSLNVANGNNGASTSKLHIVSANNNLNLTCIQHDTGFDPTTVTNWAKDATAQWSDNCSGGGSNIMYVDKDATGSNNGTSWVNAFTNLQTALTNVTANGQIWMAKGTYLPSTTQNRNDFYSINKDSVIIYGGFAGTETNLADRDISLIHTTNATILSGDLNGNDDGNMTFNNSTKTDNSLHIIEIIANNVTIDGLTISDAYADAISGNGRFGAGIWVVETKKDFTLKNSRVKNNTAQWASGMVYNPNITDSTKLTIDACIFENNLASSSSASFYYYNQNAGSKFIVEVTNTLFNGNQTMDDATLNRQAYGTPAGWIRAYEAGTITDVSLVNNTFVNNVSKGTNTNAIDFPTFGLSKRNGSFGTINVANNLFWGNTTNGDTTSHAFGSVTTTDVSMPTFNIYNSVDEQGFSNISSSNLINTSNSNPNLTADYKLQSGSPAIDAGDNTKLPSGIATDLAGNNRIYNTTVDMGCYEYPFVLVNLISVQGQTGETTITTNGGTLQMEVTILPSNATDGTYTWSVTNGTGSATIDQNGVLTAISNGTVIITATANDGSGVSGSVVITISNQEVGVNEVAFENLIIYPNPAKGVINIEVEEKLEAINLIDLSGKIIKTFDAKSQKIDVKNIAKGIYFIKVNSCNKQTIQKIILQ